MTGTVTGIVVVLVELAIEDVLELVLEVVVELVVDEVVLELVVELVVVDGGGGAGDFISVPRMSSSTMTTPALIISDKRPDVIGTLAAYPTIHIHGKVESCRCVMYALLMAQDHVCSICLYRVMDQLRGIWVCKLCDGSLWLHLMMLVHR